MRNQNRVVRSALWARLPVSTGGFVIASADQGTSTSPPRNRAKAAREGANSIRQTSSDPSMPSASAATSTAACSRPAISSVRARWDMMDAASADSPSLRAMASATAKFPSASFSSPSQFCAIPSSSSRTGRTTASASDLATRPCSPCKTCLAWPMAAWMGSRPRRARHSRTQATWAAQVGVCGPPDIVASSPIRTRGGKPRRDSVESVASSVDSLTMRSAQWRAASMSLASQRSRATGNQVAGCASIISGC